MKIALFHATLPEPGRKPGGVEVAVHRLANSLVSGGDDVTVLSLSPQPDDALYAHRRLFPRAPWLRSTACRLTVLPALLNFVRSREFDILHLHGDDWFYVSRRVPTVRTLHGSALREAASASSLKRKVSQYLIYPLEMVSARLATIPVAVGRDTASIYRTEGTVDNGVDLKLFHPGLKSPEPSLLYVGTWEGRKRGRWMCETFVSEIQPRVPEAVLVLVCDVSPRIPGVLPVRFPADTQLAELFRRAWVFAYPSVYEGFGMAYVEALASGTPVVSSPNGGAQEVLDNGRYGVIAADSDFGKAVVDLLRDPDRRERAAIEGVRRAGDFAWSAVARRHREVYSRAIARAGRRTRESVA